MILCIEIIMIMHIFPLSQHVIHFQELLNDATQRFLQ